MTAYTPTDWVNYTAPALSAANLNKLTDELELQAAEMEIAHSLPTWVDGASPALTDQAPLGEMERVADLVAAGLGDLTYVVTEWQAGWEPARNAARLNNLEQRVELNRQLLDQAPPPPPPPPSGANILPIVRVTLTTGQVAAWLVGDSPTTQIASSGSENHRLVCWGNAGAISNARYIPPQKFYALHGMRIMQGFPGRIIDYHVSPTDQPWGRTAPCNAAGVSPFSVDFSATYGLNLVLEAEDAGCAGGSGNYHLTILSVSEANARIGQWIWLWFEVLWGRKTGLGGGPTPGQVKVWVAGETNPRVNATNVNLFFSDMHWLAMWDGAYINTGAQSLRQVDITLARAGRTPRECFEDHPSIYQMNPAGNDNGPGGSITQIDTIDGSLVAVPPELRW